MKIFKPLVCVILALCLLSGCGGETASEPAGDMVLATTYPMYELLSSLTMNMEGVETRLLVAESVSCLHDYTLTTTQMKLVEQASVIVMNGNDLEHFMEDVLEGGARDVIDASADLSTDDPHYWLSVSMYMSAAETVARELAARYPQQEVQITQNLSELLSHLSSLQEELTAELSGLSCRELITFHDGFGLFAEGLDLTIAAAIEEEEGAEASARQIARICTLIEERGIPAIFVEKNGSTNAASVISTETGVGIFTLNTMMDGEFDYYTAMTGNVSAIKEALS